MNFNKYNYCYRARTWAIAAGRDDLVKNLKHSSINGILCGMHFERHMFTSEKCNRLHKWAVPTIFPSLEGSSRHALMKQ